MKTFLFGSRELQDFHAANKIITREWDGEKFRLISVYKDTSEQYRVVYGGDYSFIAICDAGKVVPRVISESY